MFEHPHSRLAEDDACGFELLVELGSVETEFFGDLCCCEGVDALEGGVVVARLA